MTIFHGGYVPDKINIRGKTQSSMEILLREYRQQPEDALANFNLATAYLDQGRYKKANSHFAKAYLRIDSSVDYKPALIRNYAACLIELQKYDEAMEVIEKGQREYPVFTDLWYLAGFIFKERGQHSKAIKAAEHCLKLGDPPSEFDAIYGVGGFRAYNLIAQVSELIKDYPQAINAYIGMIESGPGHLSAFYPLVKLLLRVERDAAAAEKRLLTYFNFSTPQFKGLMADVWYQAGQYSSSLNWAHEALIDGPYEARLVLLRGKALARQGRLQEALDELGGVFTSSMSSEALTEGCFCYWLLGEYQQAGNLIEEWQINNSDKLCQVCLLLHQAITNHAPRIVPREYLPAIYVLVQKALSLEAIQTLPDIFKLLEGIPGERPSLRLAKILWRCGHWELAAEELIDCMEEDRLDAEGCLILGKVCADKDLYIEAEHLLTKALALDTDYLQAYLLLARLYLDKARNIIADVEKGYPDNQLIRKYQQIITQAIGKFDTT
ncbi:tetratricopeptide repeat protein [Metallumcola ferriviriculae]|uniref:Tetratricopeptide repeat protein n=1 Tax=Metallumcola ferriviriculae TaxID=3039180 RepID=A0AAU0UKV8_9FIRM|nr:tetratricopeptide repeat protein [Desulfitibacteraceae bacterium MK1]